MYISCRGKSLELRGDEITEGSKKRCLNFLAKRSVNYISYTSLFKGFNGYFALTGDNYS